MVGLMDQIIVVCRDDLEKGQVAECIKGLVSSRAVIPVEKSRLWM